MAGALRTHAPLAAVQVAQWVAVLLLAASTSGDDAGRLLAFVQVGLLLPVILGSVYAVGFLTAGRRFGLWAAGLWALAPFAVIPLWDHRYHSSYVDVYLPKLVGLTHASGFRAAVLLTLALALTAAALRRASVPLAAAAGLVAGLAAAVDAAAVIGVGVPALALLLARRPRLAAAALTGAVPGAVVLAVAGAALPSFPTSGAAWEHLNRNELGFQEYFWSLRLVEWLPLAGAIGFARRSVPLAVALLALVCGWLIVIGSQPGVAFGSASFLPPLVPAAPAFFLLAAGVVQLVPPLRRAAGAPQPSASR